MQYREIGGVKVSAIALGGASWSLPDIADERHSVRTIHAAIEAGVTLIDTALAYSPAGVPSHNERLVARALREHPLGHDVLVSTKGGHLQRSGDGFTVDGRPETLRSHVEQSLKALHVDAIGLYHLHHPDPHVPLEESYGALEQLRLQGKLVMLGVSNVSVAQIEKARSVAPVHSVQNCFSILNRADQDTMKHCATEGIAYLAYSPLGGGNSRTKLNDFAPVAVVARRLQVSPQRVALAWLLAQSPHVVAVVGASRPPNIVDSAAAAEHPLGDENRLLLDAR